MLLLSALCVLLPLTAALDTCDQSLVKAFQSKSQLKGAILDTLSDNDFWFVATSPEEVDSREAYREVEFGKAKRNLIQGDFTYSDSNKNVIFTQTNYYTPKGHAHILTDEKVNIYFSQCSKNLIAGYRCRDPESSAGGTKYFVWTQSDDDVEAEFAACTKKIKKADPSASFVRFSRP